MAQDSLKELQQALGSSFGDFFPEGIEGIIEKETFQPAALGQEQTSLYTVQHRDRTMTVVMTARRPGFREEPTAVYQYDGKETITETVWCSGDVNTYEGEYGRPSVLLSHLRQSLGKRVKG